MRKDIYYYFESDVASVYNAYLMAVRSKLKREPHIQAPYYAIEFGVTFSVKYNLNGGSCILGFVPYQNGTAVNIGLFIVQLCGARCGAYARDLTNEAAKYLGLSPREISVDIELFLQESNYVRAGTVPQTQTPPAPQPTANPQNVKFCTNCGCAQQKDAKFCSSCGKNLVATKPTCPTCGTALNENGNFCTNCGTKIR